MLRFLTAGESHGKALIALVDGFPAGVTLDATLIDADLRLRQGPVLALRRLRQDQVQDRHLHRAGARARAMAPSVRSRSRRGSSSSPCTVS